MGFWLFLFLMNLILPISMIFFGNYFKNHAPKKINSFFGYRTEMSMKNQDTWKFAHNYHGKLWFIMGLVTLFLSIILFLTAIGKSENFIAAIELISYTIQIICLISSVVFTEIAIRKKFDKYGNIK